MPLLHLWQEHFGFISDEGVNWIAAKLELQPINILELVTFYPMFRQQPTGKKHIRVCRTLSCAMAGSYQVMDKFQEAAGADGNYSIEFVECLASCGTAPVCMIDDELHENVDPNSVVDLLNKEGRLPSRPSALNDGSEAVAPWGPHPLEHRLIFKNIGREDWKIDIDTYLKDGGYEQLKKAVTMSRADIVNEVKTSGLRGRGGAGFPCGVKWSFIKARRKETGLSHLQRRRIGAGDVQGSLHHPRGSAPTARRHPDLMLCA